MKTLSRRTMAAGAVCAVAALFVGTTAFWPSGTAPVTAPAAIPAIDLPPAPPPLPSIDRLTAIAETPLFLPSRTKLAPKIDAASQHDAAAPPPPQLGQPVLLGVAISPDRPVAVLQGTDGKATTLAVGATLNGWTLARILSDRVVFSYGGEQREVMFPVPAPGAAMPMPMRRPVRPPAAQSAERQLH